MMGRVETRLSELGVKLPAPSAPAANYVPFVISGRHVYISGQVTAGASGLEYRGKLGDSFTVEQGQAAARLCALNILSQLNLACEGDLDRVTRCIRICGYVNATPDFTEHPAVINGASDFIVEVFGERGRHARAAVGVASLPFDVAVEIEAIFEIA